MKLIAVLVAIGASASWSVSVREVVASSQAVAAASSSTGVQSRSRARRGRAIPRGVPRCLDRLIELGSSDPLEPYEGEAARIVNDGLMWSGEKSRCFLADADLRNKLLDAANAWRLKDAERARSLLREIRDAVKE